MKTYLYDESTFGLLYISEPSHIKKHWFFYLLRSCIVDTGAITIFPRHPLYNELNNAALEEKFYVTGPAGPSLGNKEEIGNLYLKKKQKLSLIIPLINFLMHAVTLKSTDLMASFSVPIDDTLAFEIANCNPTNNDYTAGVLEYARLLEITPVQAYQEIKLEYETMHYLKMRGYATTKKYVNMIRDVSTKQEANAIQILMENNLFKDTLL